MMVLVDLGVSEIISFQYLAVTVLCVQSLTVTVLYVARIWL